MEEKKKLRNKFSDGDELGPRGIYEWIDYYQKNKPQTNALAAGVMIILYGGQHLGWGIFNNHLKAQPWAGGYEDDGDIFYAIICWFISAIVGFFISAFAVTKCSKILIYVSRLLLMNEVFLNYFHVPGFLGQYGSVQRDSLHYPS
jgi:hypothetical protein